MITSKAAGLELFSGTDDVHLQPMGCQPSIREYVGQNVAMLVLIGGLRVTEANPGRRTATDRVWRHVDICACIRRRRGEGAQPRSS